jgi:hypothetical protein
VKLTASALELYLTSPLVVLALWQPYATLCAAPDPAHDDQPAKVHETRHWCPRGAQKPFAVAIHATKKFDGETRVSFDDPTFKAALKRCGFYPGDPRPLLAGKMRSTMNPVPLGAIVGLAIVASWMPTVNSSGSAVDVAKPAHDDDRAFGYWVPSRLDPNQQRYAWRLRDTVMLPTPIAHTGRQDALYPVDLDTRERINLQLRAMVAT